MEIVIAGPEHIHFAKTISLTIEESAKDRGTGIARRTPEYIIQKMQNGNAVIAFEENTFAGFCYIEVFRGQGLAKRIKKHVFDLSLEKFPGAKIFGITTGQAVMKINYELGYKPVHFSKLTDDPEFWKGCQTCKNFDVLTRTERKLCLCTGMLHDPNENKQTESKTTSFLSGLFKKNKK